MTSSPVREEFLKKEDLKRITAPQRKTIMAYYQNWSREERLIDISGRLGRHIESTKELSKDEASILINSFKSPNSEAAAA